MRSIGLTRKVRHIAYTKLIAAIARVITSKLPRSNESTSQGHLLSLKPLIHKQVETVQDRGRRDIVTVED